MFGIIGLLLGNIKYYLIGGVLIAAVVGGGWLYVKSLRAENALLHTQNAALKTNIKTLEKTVRLLKEYTDAEDVINNTADDDIVEYLRSGVLPKAGNPKGNGVPAPAK